MPTALACPACHTRLEVRPEHAGRTVTCPACRHRLTVPAAARRRSDFGFGPPTATSAVAAYRRRKSARQSRTVALLVVAFVAAVGGVIGAVVMAVQSREGDREQPREQAKAEPAPAKVEPAKAKPKAEAKAPPVEWAAVLSQARKRGQAIINAGKAEGLTIKAVVSARSAQRIGGMNVHDLNFAVDSLKLVQQFGVDAVHPEQLAAAQAVAPVTVALARIGKPQQVNTPAALEAVCASFPDWRAGSLDAEAARHEAATDAEVIEKGLSLALFERAKPPAVGDFRRLQVAGLLRVAYGRAVESGMTGQGDTVPAWFAGRSRSDRATSVDAEADLLVAVWATAGVLPDVHRSRFYPALVGAMEKGNVGIREVVRTAAGVLPRSD